MLGVCQRNDSPHGVDFFIFRSRGVGLGTTTFYSVQICQVDCSVRRKREQQFALCQRISFALTPGFVYIKIIGTAVSEGNPDRRRLLLGGRKP